MSLERRIMNIQATVGSVVSEALGRAYKEGHRDARHAAASLAAEHDALAEMMAQALRGVADLSADAVDAADAWAEYEAVQAALAKHAEVTAK